MLWVLCGGRVIDPKHGRDEVADVVLEDGVVKRVGRGAGDGLEGEGVRRLDVSGRWVTPGFLDLHVHLREPGQEYKEDIASGLAAAAPRRRVGEAAARHYETLLSRTDAEDDVDAMLHWLRHAAAGGRNCPM